LEKKRIGLKWIEWFFKIHRRGKRHPGLLLSFQLEEDIGHFLQPLFVKNPLVFGEEIG
jgi:hypothetical protein